MMDQVWRAVLHSGIPISYKKLDFEHEDDDFVAGSSNTAAPVVIFAAGAQTEEKTRLNKAAMRAFMVRSSFFSRKIALLKPSAIVV